MQAPMFWPDFARTVRKSPGWVDQNGTKLADNPLKDPSLWWLIVAITMAIRRFWHVQTSLSDG
jgi:hypothetical protein